jgi:hypothetical protein
MFCYGLPSYHHLALICPDRANQFGVRKTIACTAGVGQAKNGARRNTIFARGLNVIGRFKPVFENISLFQKMKSGVWSAHPATTRGVSRSSRT